MKKKSIVAAISALSLIVSMNTDPDGEPLCEVWCFSWHAFAFVACRNGA